MTANILTLDSSETEFLLIWLKNQLAKIHNSSLDTSHSARNLGFIFDEHLTFSDQITSLSKACYYHIRQIRYIRPRFVNCLYHCYLSFTPNLITVILSIINSQSLNNVIPSPSKPELSCSLVVKSPKSCHIIPFICSSNWLRITERIEYKLLSLIYKVLTTTQPPYLHNLISVQRPRSTRSSSVITLARPPTSSSLKVTDRSFRYASPCLWNQLPLSLRQPHTGTSSSISDSPFSFTRYFFLFWFTTLFIHNSLSLSLPV